jgi:hypothetical protein
MSKPNWACSSCGMYSSRRWSVERHIINLHDGISNVVPFVDYLVGRKLGFYLPKFRPTFVKKNATKTITVMDTFKDELLKGFASKAVNKALSSSPIQNHQFMNFQGFSNNGGPYFYSSQFLAHIIPRPEDIFGFEIYVCKKCSSIEPIIVSFNDGQEGGSRINWSPCCDFASFSDLREVDQNSHNDNNKWLQKIQDSLRYSVKIWTNNKPTIIAIKIPASFHGNSIMLIPIGKQKCVSVECLREKSIELKTDNYNQDHCVTRCIKDGKTSIGNEEELSVFLNLVKIATYGFFKVNNSELYLLAIANPNIELSHK